MTGITSSLATYSGQNASWQLIDLSSAITAYAGATARVVFRYQSGSSYTGDLQLDAISVGPNTYGFESGVDNFETSTGTDGATSSYDSVTSFQALATGTTAGYWNRRTGTTSSSGTGNLGAYAGSYFVYAETSSSGAGYPDRYFWLRGPEVVLESSSPTLGFALGREGATIGTLDVYLDITSDPPAVPVDVDAEGLSATSALGAPTVSGAASTGVTGVQGLVHVGTIEVGVGKTTLVSGVSASGSVGSVSVEIVPVTKVLLSGWGFSTWGTDSWGEANTLPVGTGVVGTVGVVGNAVVAVTGVAGTTALGAAEAQANALISVTGLSATGELGTLRFDAEVLLGGWGRGVWGQGSWGQSLGIQATGEIGSVTVQEGTGVYVNGVQATATLGNIAVEADGAIEALGNAATGEVGTVVVNADANFSVTGVEGTTALGIAGPITTVAINVTGVSATATAGNVEIIGDSSLDATGLQATSALGSVTVDLVINVDVTGVQGTTALGETTETADANASVTGVQATGYVGTVLVWGEIVPNQNAGWANIDDSQTPNWTDIAA